MKLCSSLPSFCEAQVLEKLCKGVDEKERRVLKAGKWIKGFAVVLL